MPATVPYGPTLERWLQRLANEDRSHRTLAAYRADLDDAMVDVAIGLGLLAERAALAGLARDERHATIRSALAELDLNQVTLDDLDGALAAFRTRPDPRYTRHPTEAPRERSPNTVARRAAAIRSFFAWCEDTGRLPDDPARKLRSPRRPRRLPRMLSDQAAERVFDSSGEGSRWPERDALIVALGLACGLRLEEIATLRIDSLVGDASAPERILVRGKGGKERSLGVPGLVTDALAAYLPTRRSLLDRLGLDARTLIVSTRPRPVLDPAGREIGRTVDASNHTVAYVVDRVLRRLGVRQRGTRVHGLRHTFAAVGLREGALNLRELQEALGHASLSTTEIYTHVTDEAVAEGMRHHPLGRRRT